MVMGSFKRRQMMFFIFFFCEEFPPERDVIEKNRSCHEDEMVKIKQESSRASEKSHFRL